MKTLGIGMLGYGFMGKMHTFAHKTIPMYYDPPAVGVSLKVVCRRTEAGARQAAEAGGYERWTTDPMAVIEADDVDVVHICTPNHQHLPQLKAAMKAGKHIYCEKPVTASLAEAEEIAGLLAGYRGKSQVVLQNRFFPATLRAKQLADEGFLGPITHFRAAYLHGGSVDANRAVNWKSTAAAGGGVIRDLGPHIIDLMHHLIGRFRSVCCTSRIWVRERPSLDRPGTTMPIDVEDAATMLLRAKDGAFGTVEVSKIATGTEDDLWFELHGRDGAMRFRLMEPNFLEVYDARKPDGDFGGARGWQRLATVQRYPGPGGKFPGPKATVGWTRGHVHCLYSFLKAIADDAEAAPSLSEGVYLQRVLEASIESAACGEWVEIE
ncbi:MAG: Gfo/Idh/MocA family oxidoreductase [Phycisphaerae bacterium]|nr:Gfo/Idh/MocA family oxidoreductase [Phycisphaerae bacterium]